MNKHYIKSVLLFTFVVVGVALTVTFVKNKPITVNIASIEKNIEVNIYGLGTVEAKVTSKLGFEVGAALINLNVDQGDKVKKGDVLAVLHFAEQEAKVKQAEAEILGSEAKLRKAEANVPKMQAILKLKKATNKRYKAALLTNSVSEEEADETQMEEAVAISDLVIARTEVKTARADLDDAKARYKYEKEILDHHILYAPYDGVVIERHKELGTVIFAGDPVFTFIDPKTVWVLGYVDEARAGYIKVGQSAEVQLRSLPNKRFQGKVTRIDIESDRVNEERRVYIACDTCPESFHLGEQAEIFVKVTELTEALLIPENSIDKFNGLNGNIWVIDNGRLHRKFAEFGNRTLDGKVEIINGIKDKLQVVIDNPKGLKEGRRVFIRKGQ